MLKAFDSIKTAMNNYESVENANKKPIGKGNLSGTWKKDGLGANIYRRQEYQRCTMCKQGKKFTKNLEVQVQRQSGRRAQFISKYILLKCGNLEKRTPILCC